MDKLQFTTSKHTAGGSMYKMTKTRTLYGGGAP